MSKSVMSRESTRRTGTERQRRWRRREAAKRRVAEALSRRLGRDATPAEMRDEIEGELGRLGLTSVPARVGDDRDADMPTGAAEDTTDAVLQDDDDDDHDSGRSSSRPVRELHRLIEQRPPSADPTWAGGAEAGRGVALASVSFELRIAEQRDRIFHLLMRRAEEGDASCLLFLASRLAPAAVRGA